MLIFSFSFLSSLQCLLVLYLTSILSTWFLFGQGKFLRESASKRSNISASPIISRLFFSFLIKYYSHCKTTAIAFYWTKAKEHTFLEPNKHQFFFQWSFAVLPLMNKSSPFLYMLHLIYPHLFFPRCYKITNAQKHNRKTSSSPIYYLCLPCPVFNQIRYFFIPKIALFLNLPLYGRYLFILSFVYRYSTSSLYRSFLTAVCHYAYFVFPHEY